MLFEVNNKNSHEEDKIRGQFILAATGKEQVHGSSPGRYQHTNIPWPLPNMAPTTETEFWNYRVSYSFQADIWNQFIIDGSHVTGIIFFVNHGFYGNGGFVVLRRADKIEYFVWHGCKHEFDRTTVGNCLTKYTCKKCKHAFSVDSSD